MMKTCVNGHLFDDKNTRVSMRNGMKLRGIIYLTPLQVFARIMA